MTGPIVYKEGGSVRYSRYSTVAGTRVTDDQLVTVHSPPCLRQNVFDTIFNVGQVGKEWILLSIHLIIHQYYVSN